MDRFPIDVEGQVVWQIHTDVVTSCDRVEGMLQFQLVDVDWDVGIAEQFEATGVIEMEVTHHYCFDIANLMASLLELVGELMRFIVVHASKDIIQGDSPYCSVQ